MRFGNDGFTGHNGSNGNEESNGRPGHLGRENSASANQAGVISYLAKLGLTDGELLEAMTLVQSIKNASFSSSARREELRQVLAWEDLLQAARPTEDFPAPPEPGSEPDLPAPSADPSGHTAIRLHIVEERQILRNAYQSFFSSHPRIQMLGCSSDTSAEALLKVAERSKPDVMLVGVKTLLQATVEQLERLTEVHQTLGLFLLFAFYDAAGIQALRKFCQSSSAGRGYLLTHTIDTADQLAQQVYWVAEGRVIIDPLVMGELVEPGDSRSRLLGVLSPKEMEVLGYIAKGYRNETIADLVSCDIKTLERHINDIYRKMHDERLLGPVDLEDRRVRAALVYLKATGLLSAEQVIP